MYIEFNQLPETARVWVYQADRPVTEGEQATILSDAQRFLTSWTAHSQDLRASCCFFYSRFLVLSVDESLNQASGCSIDKSVHFVQHLEQQYGIRFLDRSQQAFLIEETVRLVPLKDLKQAVSTEEITPETLAFNNAVATVAELNNRWLLPAAQTWLARYFKSNEVPHPNPSPKERGFSLSADAT
jgi:hypothetical protein